MTDEDTNPETVILTPGRCLSRLVKVLTSHNNNQSTLIDVWWRYLGDGADELLMTEAIHSSQRELEFLCASIRECPSFDNETRSGSIAQVKKVGALFSLQNLNARFDNLIAQNVPQTTLLILNSVDANLYPDGGSDGPKDLRNRELQDKFLELRNAVEESDIPLRYRALLMSELGKILFLIQNLENHGGEGAWAANAAAAGVALRANAVLGEEHEISKQSRDAASTLFEFIKSYGAVYGGIAALRDTAGLAQLLLS